MLSQAQIAEIIGQLMAAEEARRQLPRFTTSLPSMSEDDGYQIQGEIRMRREAAGRVVVGKKVALTNRDVQKVMGVDQPVFGYLTDDMILPESAAISCAPLLQPKIEPEIAFVMKHELMGPGVTSAKVLAATLGVMPALEIPGPRILDWKFGLPDMAADNAFASRVVLGGTITPIKGLDLRLVGVMFEKNGSLLSTGAGASALGNPVDVVAWLANKLSRYGLGLKAGDVVLPGALVVAPEVHSGDIFKATFDRLGSVSASFVE